MHHIIAIDPGETTGWAWFYDGDLVDCGQFPTGVISVAWENLTRLYARVRGAAIERGRSTSHHDNRGSVPINAQTPTDSAISLPLLVHVVVEDYRVYSWKAEDHKFSNVYTVKIVALAELCAHLNGFPVKLTLAHPVKKFCTDDKLKSWGYWQRGERHARDAVRHACFYIMQHKETPG
jgi:hypothetical protein